MHRTNLWKHPVAETHENQCETCRDMALSGLLRSKLPCLIVTPCSKQTIVKLSLPAVTSAFENYGIYKDMQ